MAVYSRPHSGQRQNDVGAQRAPAIMELHGADSGITPAVRLTAVAEEHMLRWAWMAERNGHRLCPRIG